MQISSLGVYPARDHYGTDESTTVSDSGIDGYTRSKVEAEQLVVHAARQQQFPAVILRPGFIYGPGDRSVLPRLMERLRRGQFRYLGDRQKLMNNTYVGNLVDAIFVALNRNDLVGEVFNITDGRLVTKEEFVGTICDIAGLERPTRAVPLGIAKASRGDSGNGVAMARKGGCPHPVQHWDQVPGTQSRLLHRQSARELIYNPQIDFQQGIRLQASDSRRPLLKPEA